MNDRNSNSRYNGPRTELDTSGYQDKTKICRDCQTEFLITARDQAFFASKDYKEPMGCKPCRDKRKANRESGTSTPSAGNYNTSGGYNANSGGAYRPAPRVDAAPMRDEGNNDRGSRRRDKRRRGGDDDDRW